MYVRIQSILNVHILVRFDSFAYRAVIVLSPPRRRFLFLFFASRALLPVFFFFIIRFSFCLHTVPCYCCCYYCRISLFIRHIIEILYTHTKMKSSKHSLQTGDECVCVHCVFMHTNIRSTFTSINNNILNYTYWKLYLTATSTSLSSLFITLKKTKRQR